MADSSRTASEAYGSELQSQQSGAAIEARLRQRSLDTRAGVKLTESIAKWVITVGGLMVIVAVIGIMVFFFRVVAPLLDGGEVLGGVRYQLETEQDVIWVNGDEFQTLGSVVAAGGRVITYHIPTGTEVSRTEWDFEGAEVTAVSGTLGRDQVAFGFDDGTVRFGEIGFETSATARRNLPDDLVQVGVRDRTSGGRVFTEVGTGDFRTLSAVSSLGEVEQISELPIIAIDYRVGGTRERPTLAFATVDSDGIVRVSRSRVQVNMMTGAQQISTDTIELPSLGLADGVTVTGILLSGTADRAIVASDDGVVYRYDLRNFGNPQLAERRRVGNEGVAVTAMTFLSGEESLVVGSEDGSISVYFRLQTGTNETTDGRELVRARVHAPMPGAVIDLSEAQRQKEFSAVDAAGNVWVYHSTSDQVLFEFERSGDVTTPATAMIFPRSNGVMLVSEGGEVEGWQYVNRHPEVTLGVLFSRVWYEGYNAARLRLAVDGRYRPGGAQILARPARLRHVEGRLLRHALRRAHRADGSDLHLRIRAWRCPRDHQAGHGDDGGAADGGLGLHSGTGAGSLRGGVDSRSAAWLHRRAARPDDRCVHLADAARVGGVAL
jgi:phosphate transport system permease protein